MDDFFKKIMDFWRCSLEFGPQCASRSFGSKSFKHFRMTFHVGHRLPSAPVILDIGANIGEFAEACLIRWPCSKIICCEPIPEVYEILKRRFGKNRNLKLLNVAVADKSGMKKFKYTSQSAFSSFLQMNYDFLDFGLGCESVKEILVSAKTLDELIKEEISKRIDFLKIDVEDAELFVLKGAREFLSQKRIKVIQFELNNKIKYFGWEKGDLINFLKGFEYTICRYDVKRNTPYPIGSDSDYRQNMFAVSDVKFVNERLSQRVASG